MSALTRPRSFQFQSQLHAERPFCELATFNAAYFDAIARGDEAGVKDLEDTFCVGSNGCFPKIQFLHSGEDNRNQERA